MPAVGNLDYAYGGDLHWGFPRTEEDAYAYYSMLYEVWFKGEKYLDQENVDTFIEAGYYKYNINDDFILLTINS
jgi:hypothetical protein